jgi:hypothetical protein
MTNLLQFIMSARKSREQHGIFAHKLQSALTLRLIKLHNWHTLRPQKIIGYLLFVRKSGLNLSVQAALYFCCNCLPAF